eukprot:CAMPEP_0202715594 /NCGR_PEP_ID=MMETSP1385-20130828/91909_1 /ASSEMBLY_ACC=CAM_ASM_000861 /TAXON_ID=933848 /ORGANISM="Elphidium margaritaceum" /LENGTH=45 /DNA_ID= /DNA_START= /DNA_END= /DNA_ORIENTATION=
MSSNTTVKQYMTLFESNGILTLNDVRKDLKHKSDVAKMLDIDDAA